MEGGGRGDPRRRTEADARQLWALQLSKIKRIVREMIQNSLTIRQKCSDLFHGITTRLPFWEEAESERGGLGWSFKWKKHLLVAAILPYGDSRDTVHAHVRSHMYTHIHTHTQFPVLQNP